MEGILVSTEQLISRGDDKTEDSRRHLKPIVINRRRYANADVSLYRVYTSPGEFKIVEADSAHEAYTKSGLSRVHKIERENFFRYLTVKKELIQPHEGTVSFDTQLPDRDRSSVLIDQFVKASDGNVGGKEEFTGMEIRDLALDEKPVYRSVLKAPVPDFVPAHDITDVVATAKAPSEPAVVVNNEPMSAEEMDRLFSGESAADIEQKESLSNDDLDALFAPPPAREGSVAAAAEEVVEAKESLSNDDLDALFAPPPARAGSVAAAAEEVVEAKESLSNDDLDALFAPPPERDSGQTALSIEELDKLFAPDIPDEESDSTQEEFLESPEVSAAVDIFAVDEENGLSDDDVMSLLAPPPAPSKKE